MAARCAGPLVIGASISAQHEAAQQAAESAPCPNDAASARQPQAGSGRSRWLRLSASGFNGAPSQTRPAATTSAVAKKGAAASRATTSERLMSAAAATAQTPKWPARASATAR